MYNFGKIVNYASNLIFGESKMISLRFGFSQIIGMIKGLYKAIKIL